MTAAVERLINMAQTLLLSHSSRQQHVLQPPIIFINGLPGIGKFTIAKELAVLLGGLKKVRVVGFAHVSDSSCRFSLFLSVVGVLEGFGMIPP